VTASGRVVVVARFTATDADPETGDFVAVEFPARAEAERWMRSPGWDYWWSNEMVLDLVSSEDAPGQSG
jgi:hypothetical protein